MNSLERALINLADILSANNIPYMIIGGMANAVWGEPMKRPHINPPLKGEEVEENRWVMSLINQQDFEGKEDPDYSFD